MPPSKSMPPPGRPPLLDHLGPTDVAENEPDPDRSAAGTGTAPLDASPARAKPPPALTRRQPTGVNQIIHIAPVTELRLDTEGRRYYQRKRAAGKKPREALRCLKRRLSDAIYRQLVADALRAAAADPGGHGGAS